MTEFRIANQLVADGRKKFLIPLLYENLGDEELDADLKLYIETHTYTDCKDLVFIFFSHHYFNLFLPYPKGGLLKWELKNLI